MKRIIGLILSLICILDLTACSHPQNTEQDNKNQMMEDMSQDPSENNNNSGKEETSDTIFITQEKAEEIALAQCKVNFDYIKTEFDEDLKHWRVEFWEKTAKYVPAQWIYVDTEGNITSIMYAE